MENDSIYVRPKNQTLCSKENGAYAIGVVSNNNYFP